MARLPRIVTAALVTALLWTGAGALGSPPVATAADVQGDDESDRYVGTGGLILPRGMPEPTRRTVASCAGCAWRLTTPCVEPSLGTPFAGQSGCASVTRGCPGGELLRAWFRGRGTGWQAIGLVCLGPAGPLTVADVASHVRGRVAQAVPPLQPSAQPRQGVLTQLPVLFSSGQPGGAQHWPMSLPGAEVTVTATPRWSWAFGDGARLGTAEPGQRHPAGGVAHVYRTAGQRPVDVTAEWSATFVVAGLGPFPVDEPVRQRARFTIDVGEGRAVLTPPARDAVAGMAE